MNQIQTDANLEVKSTVDNINAIAQKNRTPEQSDQCDRDAGGHANELRDERALLIDELSNIVPYGNTGNRSNEHQ